MWKVILPVFLLSCTLSLGYVIRDETEDVLIYFSRVNVTVRKSGVEKVESVTFDSNNTIVDYDVATNGSSKIVKLVFKNNPSQVVDTLNIDLTVVNGTDGYWKVSGISAVVKGQVVVDKTTEAYNPTGAAARFISSLPIEAPLKKSFHCNTFGDIYPAYIPAPTPSPFGNFTPTIQIFDLQAQVFAGNVTAFEEPWECVGFFTAGIWSGIFVAALLIGILTWGLAMIMDVKTMDRFDDPKGKAISFGGTE